MSPQLFAMVLAPLLGLFILCIGNGFLASLITLRLDAAGAPATVVGLVSASYFIGLTLGALYSDRLIARIGHIRAYSSFASLIAVTVLLQGLLFDPWAWFLLRLLGGWATVGIFLVVESWLLLASEPAQRGRLLALYMTALYGAGMLAQLCLGTLDGWGPLVPFMVAGMLASLSVVPIVILPRTSPEVEHVQPLRLRVLFQLTPTGVIGCLVSGMVLAAVYTLLPLYLQRIGLEVGEVGRMMACVILGAMLLQYPVGRWSDQMDRQWVLIVLCTVCALLSGLMLITPHLPTLLVPLLFLLGGGLFALYPVSISHATDRTPAESLVPVIQGLLLINSAGSAISPLVIAPVMSAVGASGLAWSFLVLTLGLALFFLWRRNERPAPAPVAPFAAVAPLSPTGAELRVTEDLVQGAQDHDAEDLPDDFPLPTGEDASEESPAATPGSAPGDPRQG